MLTCGVVAYTFMYTYTHICTHTYTYIRKKLVPCCYSSEPWPNFSSVFNLMFWFTGSQSGWSGGHSMTPVSSPRHSAMTPQQSQQQQQPPSHAMGSQSHGIPSSSFCKSDHFNHRNQWLQSWVWYRSHFNNCSMLYKILLWWSLCAVTVTGLRGGAHPPEMLD